ncbi:flagellin N-terminal helical domain-containing protein [Fluviispira vulneris]|uniref:flagellin N-terminal helical domain-containing protein n=1 Tax=Fluviispira vulneris TaxID=2763012 RepID=UPI0016471167|nr:flagellin [Fluviispira vulneris]
MGLRIRTNVESLSAQRFLSNNNADMNSSMEKLSSGLRINKSSDDAAGLAISEGLRAKTRGLMQAKRNANDGVSLVQVAEGGLNETSNILIRMRELTVQSASDTVGIQERGFLDKEYQNLMEEIDRISDTTEFNGRKLLGPQTSENGVILQVGYNGTANDILKLQLGDAPEGITSETLGIKDSSLAGEDREKIAENLSIIDAGLYMVANTRATLGATQSRLNSAISNISVSTENMMAANSRIRDADFAEETAKMTQSRILSQAGLAVLSQANQRPEMALSLLR